MPCSKGFSLTWASRNVRSAMRGQVQVATKIVMKSACRTWATVGSCHTRVWPTDKLGQVFNANAWCIPWNESASNASRGSVYFCGPRYDCDSCETSFGTFASRCLRFVSATSFSESLVSSYEIFFYEFSTVINHCVENKVCFSLLLDILFEKQVGLLFWYEKELKYTNSKAVTRSRANYKPVISFLFFVISKLFVFFLLI